MNENKDVVCASEGMQVWFIGVAVFALVILVWTIVNRHDIRRAQKQHGNVEAPLAGLEAKQVAFVPPWRRSQPPNAVTGATPQRISFSQVIGIVSPSVVSINTFGTQKQSGSAIIVHRNGYILTAYHVIAGAKNIVATLVRGQGVKVYPAKVVDVAPNTDLAIIKITAVNNEIFTPAPLGNSDMITIGEDVLSIGSPFGLQQSASSGIISNNKRTLTFGDKIFRDLIQTDTPLNPGSSGGPLVNAKGQVIGINVAIYSPTQTFSGVGFAIPINRAKSIFPEFIEIVQSPMIKNDPRIKQPAAANLKMIARRAKTWLGIDIHPVKPIIAEQFKLPVPWGVLVNRVFDNSPGQKAGLVRGDIIFRVNNRIVENGRMLWSVLEGKKPGDKVRITLFRQGKKKNVVLKLTPPPPNVRSLLSKAPKGAAAGAAGAAGIEEISWLGIDIQPLTDAEALTEFGIPPGSSGVLVGEVEGVAAIDAGLKAGDLIKRINNLPVKDIKAFKESIKKVDISKGVVLDIVRQKRPYFITIRPTKKNRGAWQ